MKPKVVVAIAIILGLITSVLVYTMLGTPELQEQEKTEKISVVIAKENINSRQKITADMIEVKKIPESQAHFEALKSVEKVTDRYASDKIIGGEQILKSRLYSKETTDSVMAFKLGPKERAVTVAVNEVTGVAGFLMPGDYVDVVGVFSGADDTLAKTVLQNVKVLAVAQEMTSNKNMEPQVKKSVTLAVGLEETEKLVLADREGNIRLALRSPKNEIQRGSNGLSLNKLLGIKKEKDKETTEEEADSQEQESKTTPQQKKSVKQAGTDKTKQENISKTVEIIKGTEKVYEQIFIKKEGN